MTAHSMLPCLLNTLYEDALDLVRDARDMIAAAPPVDAETSTMPKANIAAMPLVARLIRTVAKLAELRDGDGVARPDAATGDGVDAATLLPDGCPAYLEPLAARFAQIERRYAQLRLGFGDGPPTVQLAVDHACKSRSCG